MNTILNWDSDRLHCKVAKITATTLDTTALAACLNNLKKQHIDLVYWVIDQHDATANTAAIENKGFLVDHKVTYLIDLHTLKSNMLNTPHIEIYAHDLPDEHLIQLAYTSGEYSRFRRDPRLTEQQFQAIYKEWMINSTNHEVAEEVFVIKGTQHIDAMITVGEKNHRGDIGLLAVSERVRGKKFGTELVYAAQKYFMNKGYRYSQVVTQLENIPACRLYEKCGYTQEKVEHFYHFWLS